MIWYVYLLRCKDNSLYCGITNNLEKRIKIHNSGKGAKYTKTRRPVYLEYKEEYATKGEALKREYQIKQLSKYVKERMISNGR